MNILISVVTYNSYEQLDLFLRSIIESADNIESLHVVVHVADNSSYKKSVSIEKSHNVEVFMHLYDNLGYFGGAFKQINELTNSNKFDYVIISNADIVISKTFFAELIKVHTPPNTAWIAGKIMSRAENRDRNPKIKKRYSLKKLRLQRLVYRFPILDWIYTNTLYKRKAKQMEEEKQDIYAGHGSFIILTTKYFEKYPTTQYPVFLFGEELFLAERIRIAELKVVYEPLLTVFDMEHASTGKMKKSFYYKCNREAIDYILKTFYNE